MSDWLDDFDDWCPVGIPGDIMEENMHCECWWDGEMCCRCHAPSMTHEEKVAQGMEPA